MKIILICLLVWALIELGFGEDEEIEEDWGGIDYED